MILSTDVSEKNHHFILCMQNTDSLVTVSIWSHLQGSCNRGMTFKAYFRTKTRLELLV